MIPQKAIRYVLAICCILLVSCNEVKPANEIKKTVNEITEKDKDEILQIREDDVVLGNPDAVVKIIEYFSLTCYHCADFHRKILKPFKEEYIDKGIACYVGRLLPFDKQALDGSILIKCAPKEQYHNFVKVLLEQQNNWVFSKDYKAILTQIGQLGGVGANRFKECLEDVTIKEKIIDNVREASKLGINATPEIYINGKSYANTGNYQDFVKAVEAARKSSVDK
ncbi:MAG: DsbA family protein [Rickettsiaceae bacterium]|jgi:protein-disulfide isomerase|nr:DsbA family protein [Rickettsiaceae bacterium]